MWLFKIRYAKRNCRVGFRNKVFQNQIRKNITQKFQNVYNFLIRKIQNMVFFKYKPFFPNKKWSFFCKSVTFKIHIHKIFNTLQKSGRFFISFFSKGVLNLIFLLKTQNMMSIILISSAGLPYKWRWDTLSNRLFKPVHLYIEQSSRYFK